MRIGVVVLTGFLGSGKTTLLRSLLRKWGSERIAVIVNEAGDVTIDKALVKEVSEEVRFLGGGCSCCNMREDLVSTLRELLSSAERGEIPDLRWVVIETSGLADPAPIAFTILNDPVLQHHYRLERIVATVGADLGFEYLERHLESRKQVMVADCAVITKVDLVERRDVERLIEKVKSINPFAEVVEAVYGDVDPSLIIGERGEKTRLETLTDKTGISSSEASTLSITFEKPVDWAVFTTWLGMLLYSRGEQVLRVKGVLNIEGEGPIVINAVQHTVYRPEHLRAEEGKEEKARVVFVMKEIDPDVVKRSLEAFQRYLGAEPIVEFSPSVVKVRH